MSELQIEKMNDSAAQAIGTSPLSGPVLLDMFQQVIQQCALLGADSNHVQFDFVTDPGKLKKGDWVPTLSLSVRKFEGHVVMENGELTSE